MGLISQSHKKYLTFLINNNYLTIIDFTFKVVTNSDRSKVANAERKFNQENNTQ